MTWPALRALRRTYPSAEIHLLTRPRFDGAVEGLDVLDQHHSLKVSTILSPLVQEEPDLETAVERLNAAVEELRENEFDWIINLTFSPVSSYLTKAISAARTQVSGYSRFSDGTLHLPDEMSAYFYAQIGAEKSNRVHLADFFAALLNLEYVESDWGSPNIKLSSQLHLPSRYVVLHVGASEAQKSLQADHWSQALKVYHSQFANLPLVLVGANDEQEIATNIQRSLPSHHIVNLVGKTQIRDLFQILAGADLLIGCDSAPIHMASLTDTPTFNVSIGKVNFWETGPKASLGFIYRVDSLENLNAHHLGSVLCQTLNSELNAELWVRSAGLVSYCQASGPDQDFAWGLVQALYLGGAFPLADKMEIIEGATRLNEMNEIAASQISLIPTRGLSSIGPILDRIEEAIQSVGQLVPELGPLVRWYQAEKIRIGPSDLPSLCQQAQRVHERFAKYLQAYVLTDEMKEESHGEI